MGRKGEDGARLELAWTAAPWALGARQQRKRRAPGGGGGPGTEGSPCLAGEGPHFQRETLSFFSTDSGEGPPENGLQLKVSPGQYGFKTPGQPRPSTPTGTSEVLLEPAVGLPDSIQDAQFNADFRHPRSNFLVLAYPVQYVGRAHAVKVLYVSETQI